MSAREASRDAPRLRAIPVLLSAVFAAHAFAHALATPVYQTPDEPLHLATIRYVHQNLRIADASRDRIPPEIVRSMEDAQYSELRGRDASVWATREWLWRSLDEEPGGRRGTLLAIAGHPPAYYVLAAPFSAATSALSFPAAVLVLRLLTALLAIPIVLFTWGAARALFPGDLDVAVAAAAFVALLPQLAHVSGSLSNDPLVATAFAATWYVAARLLASGPSRRLLAAGALAALAASFTKAQGVLAVVVFGAAAAWSARAFGARLRTVIPWTLAPAVAALGWYAGRLLAGLPVLPPEAVARVEAPRSIGLFAYARGYALPILTESFWGKFGWLAASLQRPVYVVLDVLAAAGVAGTTRALARDRRARRAATVFMAIAGGALLLTGILLLRDSWGAFGRTGLARGLQGRYLFPWVGVLGVVFAGGLALLVPARLRRAVTAALIAGLAALALDGLWTTVSWFYGPAGWGTLGARLSAFSPVNVAAAIVLVLAAIVCAGSVAVILVRFRLDLAPSGEPASDLVHVS